MTARVLVVDDVDANVKLLEARLTAEYLEVRTARSGREALEICANERADVVLLDVMMPGMDGFEVCRRLKSEPRTQHIPVIMVTALDHPSDRVRGPRGGGRRLSYQAGGRHRAGEAGEEPGAAQDADRRDAASPEIGSRPSTTAPAGAGFSWWRTRTPPCSASRKRCKTSSS